MAHKRRSARGAKSFGIATGGGVLAGLAVGMVLIFCLAAVAYRMSDPATALLPMGLAALGISAMTTGRVSCLLWDNRSLIPPLAAGGAYALLIAAAGLCITGSTLDVWVRCLGCPCVLGLAVLGGVIGRKGARGRRHR